MAATRKSVKGRFSRTSTRNLPKIIDTTPPSQRLEEVPGQQRPGGRPFTYAQRKIRCRDRSQREQSQPNCYLGTVRLQACRFQKVSWTDYLFQGQGFGCQSDQPSRSSEVGGVIWRPAVSCCFYYHVSSHECHAFSSRATPLFTEESPELALVRSPSSPSMTIR